MKVELKNIGIIANAKIELKGITVIGGENDTGKSTVNRAIYAVCNGCYHNHDKIESAREESISEQLFKYSPFGRQYGSIRANEIAHDILADCEKYSDPQRLKELLQIIPANARFSGFAIDKPLSEEEWKRLLEGIIDRLNIPESVLFQTVIQDLFHAEFHGQINRFGMKEGYVRLTAEEESIEIIFEDDG